MQTYFCTHGEHVVLIYLKWQGLLYHIKTGLRKLQDEGVIWT